MRCPAVSLAQARKSSCHLGVAQYETAGVTQVLASVSEQVPFLSHSSITINIVFRLAKMGRATSAQSAWQVRFLGTGQLQLSIGSLG